MTLTAVSACGHNRGHNGAVILDVSFRLYFLLDALRQIDDLLQIIARLIDYLVQFIPPETSDKIDKKTLVCLLLHFLFVQSDSPDFDGLIHGHVVFVGRCDDFLLHNRAFFCVMHMSLSANHSTHLRDRF